MTADQLYNEVIKKLIGSIEPVGESHTDAERLENLDTAIALCDRISADIMSVAMMRFQPEHSIAKAGIKAFEGLKDIRDNLNFYKK